MMKRMLSVILCLLLCLSSIAQAMPAVRAETEAPEAAEAAADTSPASVYGEGDIPGTTGTGTSEDPVVCDTFPELCSALQYPGITYVQLDPANGSLAPSQWIDSAISVTDTKTLILNGSSSFTTAYPQTNYHTPSDFIRVQKNGSLHVTGAGSITYVNHYAESYLSTAVIDNYGILTVDGDVVLRSDFASTVDLGANHLGSALSNVSGGSMTLNGGTYLSNTYSGLMVSGGTVQIKKAAFNSDRNACYGLFVTGTGEVTIHSGAFYAKSSSREEGIYLTRQGYSSYTDLVPSTSTHDKTSDGTITVTEMIRHVSIPGFRQAIGGKTPEEIFAFEDGESELEEQGVFIEEWGVWNETNTQLLANDRAFTVGKDYSVYVLLDALDWYSFDSGCTFDFKNAVSVDTAETQIEDSYASVWSAAFTVRPVPVTGVTIRGYDSIVGGNTPAQNFRFDSYEASLAEQGVRIKEWFAYRDTGPTGRVGSTDQFEYGKRYSVCLKLEALTGYVFDSSCAFDFEGKTARNANRGGYNSSDGVFTVWTETVDALHGIASISIPGGAPIIGEKTPQETFSFDDYEEVLRNQGMDLASWSVFCDTDDMPLSKSSDFVPGKQYSVKVVLNARQGYAFTAACAFGFLNGSLNGLETDPEFTAVTNGGNSATVWSKPVTAPVPIDYLQVPGFDPIVAGKTPAETFDFDSYAAAFMSQGVALDDWYVYENDGGELGRNDPFVAGRSYVVYTAFKPLAGYVISDGCMYQYYSNYAGDYVCTAVMDFSGYNRNRQHYYAWSAPMTPAKPFTVRCGCTCSFDECLAVNYYVPDADLSGFSSIKLEVRFEKWSGTKRTLTDPVYLDWTSGSSGGMACHKFSFSGISAPEVGSRIYAAVTAVKNGVSYRSQIKDYSISDYCHNMLENGSADAGLKKLCVNVLNYASAAQTYFNVNPAKLCSADLTAAQQALAGADAEVHDTSSTVTFSGVKLVNRFGKNVNFASAPELIIMLDLASGANGSELELRCTYYSVCRGKQIADTVSLTKPDAYWRGTLHGFASGDMCQPVTITAYKNGVQVSDAVTYSLECYCYKMLHTPVTDGNRAEMSILQPLCRQMMNYSAAAKAYFVK